MKKLLVIPASFLIPSLAFAQEAGFGLKDILQIVYNLLNDIIPILIVLAVLFFFYGLAMFIFKAGDEEARKKGVSIMIYGIIGLFVIVSVWGLVAILQHTFNVNQDVQTVQGPSNINDVVPNGSLPF